jgi:hypothetical protein
MIRGDVQRPLISTDGQNSLIVQAQVKHAEDEMVRAFDEEQASAIPGPIDLPIGTSAVVS